MAHSKLYVQLMNSREWRELREAKIRANPLCECCQAKGYVVPSRCVHHIVEVESGRTEKECRDLCFPFDESTPEGKKNRARNCKKIIGWCAKEATKAALSE